MAYFSAMRVRSFLSASVLFLGSVLLLPSCVTTDGYSGGTGEPYTPAVSIPRDLDETEQRLVYEVEDTLRRAGYRIGGRSAEYELDFRIESGPINTDTHLVLLRDGSEVATAYARSSGILNRPEVVRQSFRKALYEFERQVPRVRSSGGSDYGSGPSYDRDRGPDYDRPRRDDSYDRGDYDRSGSYNSYQGY